MAYELKQNEGSAFKNSRKEKDGHPDFTGEFNVNGKLHWFDVWQNTTRAGETYFKARIREKQVKPADGQAMADTFERTLGVKPTVTVKPARNLDDEVPF